MFRPKTAKKATDPGVCIAARCEEQNAVPLEWLERGIPPLCQAHGQEWDQAGRPSLEDMRKRAPRAGDKEPSAVEPEAPAPKPEKKPRAGKGAQSDLEKQLAERGPQLTASLAFLQANIGQPPEWLQGALAQIEEQRAVYSKWLETEAAAAQERHKAEIDKLGATFRPILDTLDACEKLCRSAIPGHGYRWRIATPSMVPAQFKAHDGTPHNDMIDLYVRSRGKEAAAAIGVELFE